MCRQTIQDVVFSGPSFWGLLFRVPPRWLGVSLPEDMCSFLFPARRARQDKDETLKSEDGRTSWAVSPFMHLIRRNVIYRAVFGCPVARLPG